MLCKFCRKKLNRNPLTRLYIWFIRSKIRVLICLYAVGHLAWLFNLSVVIWVIRWSISKMDSLLNCESSKITGIFRSLYCVFFDCPKQTTWCMVLGKDGVYSKIIETLFTFPWLHIIIALFIVYQSYKMWKDKKTRKNLKQAFYRYCRFSSKVFCDNSVCKVAYLKMLKEGKIESKAV